MITQQTVTVTSPAVTGVKVVEVDNAGAPAIFKDLDHATDIAVYLTLQGATGDDLGVVLQCSHNGKDWFDWFRSDDIVAAAAATILKVVPKPWDGSHTVVGNGTTTPPVATPALAKGTVAPGNWGSHMRIVFVPGTTTSAGAVQIVTVVSARPTAG